MAFNITNGSSRLISGFLSDIVGRKTVMTTTFLLAGGAYYLLPHVSGITIWSVLVAVIGFAFGTLFAVSAPLVSDCFGMEHFETIFGVVFTAFGFVSGALGPWLGGYLLDLTQGNFTLVFVYLGSLMISSSVMIWITTPYTECTF
jgi:OFA family oxalate/formate antiporter-like MFS transporter